MSNTLKQLKRAKEIVDRYLARDSVFPRELRDCGRSDPVRQQEYRDACKIKTWKYSLMGKNRYTCSDEVRDYLDENMPGWRDRVYSHKGRSSTTQMCKARDIVQRYRERGCVRPRRLNDPSREQEYKDAVNLSTWKSALKGHNRVTCSSELRDFLDEHIPGWREDHNCRSGANTTTTTTTSDNTTTTSTTTTRTTTTSGNTTSTASSAPPDTPVVFSPRVTTPRNIQLAGVARPAPTTATLMPVAAAIVQRYQQRGAVLPSLKAECRQDPSRAQECKDAGKLHSWKIHTAEKLTPEVIQYLDEQMPGWKKSAGGRGPGAGGGGRRPTQQKHSALHMLLLKAREVTQRCLARRAQGLAWLPRHLPGRQETPLLILEQKDALKLSEWKRAALVPMLVPVPEGGGVSGGVEQSLQQQQQQGSGQPIPWELKAYLDKELSGWMSIDAESAGTFPPPLLPVRGGEGGAELSSLQYHSGTDSDLESGGQGQGQGQGQHCVALAVKKGTHIRAKPTPRSKATAAPHPRASAFRPIPSSSPTPSPSPPPSSSLWLGRLDRRGGLSREVSDDELEAEQLGVEALLQLSNPHPPSHPPPLALAVAAGLSPQLSCGSSGSSSPTGYYSSDMEWGRLDSLPLPPPLASAPRATAAAKRVRDTDDYGAITASASATKRTRLIPADIATANATAGSFCH